MNKFVALESRLAALGVGPSDDQISRLTDWIVVSFGPTQWQDIALICADYGVCGVYTDLRERMSEVGI